MTNKQEILNKPTWEKGWPPDFWMEENPPAGWYHYYIFDSSEPPMSKELHSLLHVLNSLGVIEYGIIYETIEAIRIKADD